MIMYVKIARFHQTITRPAILCGSECWVTYIQQIQKIECCRDGDAKMEVRSYKIRVD